MTRIICEWCGSIIINKSKRFCSKTCTCRYNQINVSQSTKKSTPTRKSRSRPAKPTKPDRQGNPLSADTKAKLLKLLGSSKK